MPLIKNKTLSMEKGIRRTNERDCNPLHLMFAAVSKYDRVFLGSHDFTKLYTNHSKRFNSMQYIIFDRRKVFPQESYNKFY